MTTTITGTPGGNVYTEGNILGAVSQVGGVPTGALVEYGSNVNGEYWRYAGGMQVCSHISATTQNATTTIGAVFGTASSESFTFPAEFLAAPVISPAVLRTGTARVWASVETSSATSCAMVGFAHGSASGALKLGYIAIGRWY